MPRAHVPIPTRRALTLAQRVTAMLPTLLLATGVHIDEAADEDEAHKQKRQRVDLDMSAMQ